MQTTSGFEGARRATLTKRARARWSFTFAVMATILAALVGSIVAPAAVASASTSGTVVYTANLNIPPPPSSNFSGAAAGGDGWGVALTSTQIFNVFHHQTYLGVNCHNQSDASACWSGPKTITDLSGNGFATSGQPGLYIDQASGHLFVFATRMVDSTPGVVCIDTTQPASNPDPFCGFTALAPAGQTGDPNNLGLSDISDPVQVGTNWYAFNYVNGTPSGADDELLCFSLTTFSACANQPFAVSSLGLTGSSTVAEGTFPAPSIAGFGSKIVIPIDASGGGLTSLGCFDASTATSCTGTWPVATGFNYAANYGAAVPLLSATGTETGFCLPTGGDPCFGFDGSSVVTPPNLTSVVTASDGWNSAAVVIGPRIYVPNGNPNGGSGDVECFDYSTDAGCASFPKTFSGLGYLYSVNPDPQRPTCIWVNADNGSSQIQNFDAYTGGPCGQGPIRVTASSFVAPSSQCQPSSWTSMQITNPSPPSVYGGGSVEFEDADGNALAVSPNPAPLAADGSVDLSTYNFPTTLPQFVLTLNSPPANLSTLTIQFNWEGTPSSSCTQPGTAVSGQVSLNGPAGSAQFGGNQTLTASVEADGSPTSGATVTFTCVTGPCTTSTGTAVTDATGTASFTYSSGAAGTDVWEASYTPTAGGPETSGQASVIWTSGTTTALALDNNPAVTGQNVTATATVAVTAPGSDSPTAPTGAVTFQTSANGGTTWVGASCGPKVLTWDGTTHTGSAGCVLSSSGPSAGFDVRAVYSGDGNFGGSSSSPVAEVIDQAATTTALAVAPNSPVANEPMTAAATVSIVAPGSDNPTAPTGTVDFQSSADGGASWTDTTCSAQAITWDAGTHTGVANCSLPPSDPGPVEYRAIYGGDTDFTGSTSSTDPVVIEKAATGTSLALAPVPAVTGRPVVATATVTVPAPSSDSPTAPSGAVTFQTSVSDGATWVDASCGSQTLSWSTSMHAGTAACLLPSGAAVGGEELRALYSGDSNFLSSTSPAGDAVINQAGTTTAVNLSPGPSVTGQAVTATATVDVVSPGTDSPTAPTGTVEFQYSLDGGSTWTDTACTSQTLTWDSATHAGQASCDLSGLPFPSGTEFRALYSGDSNFADSTSPAATQTVNPASTAVGIAVTPTAVVAGQALTASATVTVTAPGSDSPYAPTGTVEFQQSSDGLSWTAIPQCLTQEMAWSATTHSGVASCPVAYGVADSGMQIRAEYSGDGNFYVGTSGPSDPVVVSPAGSSTELVLPSATTSGQPVTLGATVSPDAPGTDTPVAPSGSVVFEASSDGGATFTPIAGCGSVLLLWNSSTHTGSASCATAFAASGPGEVEAVYSGDTDFQTSTSGPESLTVNPAGTTTSMSLTADPVASGQAVTASATIAISAPGADTPVPPTGSVDFEASVDTGVTFTSIPGCGSVSLNWSSTTHSGTASCPTAFDAQYSGSRVRAVYSGDGNFSGSTSPMRTMAVTLASTSTVLHSSADPSVSGQPFDATATVSITTPGSDSPVAPSGTVLFQDSTDHGTTWTTIVGCTAVPVSWASGEGSALCPQTYLTSDSGTELRATYSGDSNFTSSSSNVTTQTVQKAATSAFLRLLPAPTVSGQSVVATGTVSITNPGSDATATPTGSVAFQISSDGGSTWATVTGCGAVGLDWNSTSHLGTAICSTAFRVSTSGSQARIVYSGDANFLASTSVGSSLSVGQDTSVTTLRSTPNPSTPAAPVTFRATVMPAVPGSGHPTGTVTFTDGSKILCPAVKLVGQVASCTVHLPVQPFAQAITAAYSGDTQFIGSTARLTHAIQHGYWLVASDGGVFQFGDAHFYGSTGNIRLNQPVVGIAATRDGKGYWLVASDGGIFQFGDAPFYGSTGNVHLNKPVIGMTPTADGKGYYLVASDGGVFQFGDARFYGSTGSVHLAAPIVGMVLTPDGKGYYLVGADGRVFPFGDAKFHGSSAGSIPAGVNVVGLAPTADLGGYWLGLSDGRVLPFGNAYPYGSVSHLAKPIVGIAATSDGSGYWTVAADGGLFNFGDAFFDGSTGGQRLTAPVVGMTDI